MGVQVALPVRTTLEDIVTIGKYLATKPTGATLGEARKVLGARYVDVRKLAGLEHWGLIENYEGRYRLTDDGRAAIKNNSAGMPDVLRRVIRRTPPYNAIVERVAHKGEDSLSATEVGAHWHTHFQDETSDSDEMLNAQAVCFFQVASGAGLGTLVIGRRGAPTRFDFDATAVG